jgi:hypothetical protein
MARAAREAQARHRPLKAARAYERLATRAEELDRGANREGSTHVPSVVDDEVSYKANDPDRDEHDCP